MRSYFADPRRAAALGALFTLVTLLLLWGRTDSWNRSRLLTSKRSQVLAELDPYGNALTSVINRRLTLLEGLAAHVQVELGSSDEIPEGKIEPYVAALYASAEGIRNLSVAPGGVQRYVYPLAGNENVPGHDLIRDERPSVRADVQRAIESRQITVSGPYELRQGGQGLEARLAIYRDDLFWGLVTIVLDVPPILTEAGLEPWPTGLEVALRDGSGQTFYGDSALFDADPITHPVGLPERSWELAAVPASGWFASIQEPLTLIRVSLLAVIVLAVGLVYLAINQQARLALAVRQRTQEISQVNEDLEHELGMRRQAEVALRDSEARYHNVSDLTSDWIYSIRVNGDGSLDMEWTAGAIEQITSYSPEEAEAMGGWTAVIHPDDLSTMEARTRTLLSNQECRTEYRLITKSGEVRWLMNSERPEWNEAQGRVVRIIGAATDITERKRAEEEIERSRQSLQVIYDTILDAIIMIDAANNIVSCNQSVQKVLGYTPDELVGKSYLVLIPEEVLTDPEQPARQEELFEKGYLEQEDYAFRRKNGEVFPASFSVALIRDEQGNPVGMVGTIKDITERKRAEEALRKAWRAVEQSPASIVITDTEGSIEYVNPKFFQLTGYTAEEAIGQNPRVLKSGEHPPEFYKELWDTITSGQEWRGEFCNKKKNGELYWESASISPVRDAEGNITHFVAVKEDITERKRAEEALRRYADRLATLHEVDQGILSAYSLEEIAQAALGHLRQLGPYERASVAHFDHEANQYSYLAVSVDGETQLGQGGTYPLESFRSVDKLRRGETHVVEDLSTIPDLSEPGRQLLSEGIRATISAPLIAEEELVGVLNLGSKQPHAFTQEHIEIAQEVAGQLAVALHQAQLYQRLQQTNVKLEEAIRARDEMIQNVSHELRTPLTHIIGYSELLSFGGLGGDLTEEQSHAVRIIHDRANALARVVNMFLDLQTLATEDLDQQPVDLGRLARATMAEWEERVRRKRISADLQIAPEVPPIGGDSQRLQEAIHQLMDNALKFSDQGGTISVRIEPKGDEVWLSVSDTGIGIPPDQLERVFVRFHQVDGSTTRSHGGAGLGLPLVQAIVSLHHGRVWIESDGVAGHGTTVVISLPVGIAPEPEA